ncbi:MAG: 16S rRNA (guanine(966)-N(2))-methyltransferase RsmD [Gemmatimonadetes bacterium]|nr:16S rRNA (guanine(966)-N(2))-methyltransferase RsmD [Gemmatimonadota bacterium]
MRIIAGEFRGRTLRPPGDRRTRPTADRVREAWFSILGNRLSGATVVDLFAGSGALGLEALSRGASHVEFVEVGKSAVTALRANVAALDAEERVKVHRVDALRFVDRLDEGSFDIAFADPPYGHDHGRELIRIFQSRPFAGILGIEHRSTDDIGGDETRRYGDSSISFCYGP